MTTSSLTKSTLRAQASLEFLIILAAYLGFLFVLINVQFAYISGLKPEEISVSGRARNLAFVVTEQTINNDLMSVPIRWKGCSILRGTSILCWEGNSTSSSTIYHTIGGASIAKRLS